MIRRALLAAVICFAGGRAVFAVTDIDLWVDVDGTAYLRNNTAGPLSFDGYQIATESAALDPAGWDSISDRVPARINELIAQLGAGALTFGEANPGKGQLAEVNLGGWGTLAAGAKFSLGKPFGEGGYYVSFFFREPSGPSPQQNPIFIPRIPEPSTFVLAALAGLGLLAVRRRCVR